MKKNLVLVLALLIAQPAQSQTQETQLLEQLQSPLCQGSCPLLYFSLFFRWAG